MTKRPKFVPVDHPDVKPVFENVLETIVAESDRGAVLVASAVVDDYLGKLFEGILPATASSDLRKQFLKYPNPLSSMAAKADVAFITHLIPASIHRATTFLRKLRNVDVAHTRESFRLADHMDKVRAISEALGPGISHFVNESAIDVLMRGFVSNVLDAEQKEEAEGQQFKTPQEVVDYLRHVPEAMATLQQKSFRLEIALSAALICSTLMMRRDEIKNAVGDAGLVGSANGEDAA